MSIFHRQLKDGETMKVALLIKMKEVCCFEDEGGLWLQ
jgi:hypothetical protein